MLDAINHLKMAAEDYRRLTTPNQFTITEAAARENERLANQFDLAAEALRQMHNRMFEEGIVAGVKSLVDSCNARRLRKASPASVPEGYVLVPVEALIRWNNAFSEELSAWDIDPPLHHVKTSYDEISAMLAAAPTPPVSEDRWLPIETAPKDGSHILICSAINADNKPMGESFGLFVHRAAWWEGEGWIVYNSLVHENLSFFQPTHWMPLPKAPAMQEDKP